MVGIVKKESVSPLDDGGVSFSCPSCGVVLSCAHEQLVDAPCPQCACFLKVGEVEILLATSSPIAGRDGMKLLKGVRHRSEKSRNFLWRALIIFFLLLALGGGSWHLLAHQGRNTEPAGRGEAPALGEPSPRIADSARTHAPVVAPVPAKDVPTPAEDVPEGGGLDPFAMDALQKSARAEEIRRAREAADRFVRARGEQRLAWVRPGPYRKRLRELAHVSGEWVPSGKSGRLLELAPSLQKAGVVAFLFPGKPHDGEGEIVLCLSPWEGEFMVDGALFAQSYYGVFRRFIAQPTPGSLRVRTEMEVSGRPDHDGSVPVRLRDLHSSRAVELIVPGNAPIARALAKMEVGTRHHATVALAWNAGEHGPKFLRLDAWICWGYQGMDASTRIP